MLRTVARDLPDAAEPISVDDLAIGEIYFAVRFADEQLLVPIVEPIVYIGKDLEPGDEGLHYFQDAETRLAGVDYESAIRNDGASLYPFRASELNYIFTFRKAIDRLLVCAVRRDESLDTEYR